MKHSPLLKALFGPKDPGRAAGGAQDGKGAPEPGRRCPYDPSILCPSRTESGCWSCPHNGSLF